LHIDADVTGVNGQREPFSERQARFEVVVDQQPPEVATADWPTRSSRSGSVR
jgi:hypothetical protein